jgi:dUTP pyrophosphatase
MVYGLKLSFSHSLLKENSLQWGAKYEGQMTQQTIKIHVLDHGKGLDLPDYATPQSAGVDLRAAVTEGIILKPGERGVIPTGFCLELPDGFEAQIRARSGLAVKHGIAVLNAPGTIDPDYRGEVKGILINLGAEPFVITPGLKFAQMIIAPFTRVTWEEVEAVDMAETQRGSGGFGSTGKY